VVLVVAVVVEVVAVVLVTPVVVVVVIVVVVIVVVVVVEVVVVVVVRVNPNTLFNCPLSWCGRSDNGRVMLAACSRRGWRLLVYYSILSFETLSNF